MSNLPARFMVEVEIEIDGEGVIDAADVHGAVSNMFQRAYDNGFLPDDVEAWLDSFVVRGIFEQG